MARFGSRENGSEYQDKLPESLPQVDGQTGTKPSDDERKQGKTSLEDANLGSNAAEDFLMKHLPQIEE